jgi:TolB protein
MAKWPAWSPDGRELVFTSHADADGNGDIYVVNADGSGERRLTHSKLDETSAVWSSVG